MKQVRCVNAKSYQLTVGQEYTVNDSERQGYYSLVNNAGRAAEYATDLFEDVRVESTLEEVLETLEVSHTDTNIIVRYVINGENRRILIRRLTFSDSEISCGIKELSGVNGLTSTIIESISDSLEGLLQAIITEVYDELLNECSPDCAMVLVSTNINDENFNLTSEALDSISTYYNDSLNPNSSNTIRLWVVDKNLE